MRDPYLNLTSNLRPIYPTKLDGVITFPSIYLFSNCIQLAIMAHILGLLEIELGKWNKSMLIDFILHIIVPGNVKLNHHLSLVLNEICGTYVDPNKDVSVSSIFHSVVSELAIISRSNFKLHDKLNKIALSPNVDALPVVIPVDNV